MITPSPRCRLVPKGPAPGFGELSPSTVWHAARTRHGEQATDGPVTYRKELAWRDFSYHLFFHHPKLASENLDRRFDAFEWHDDEVRFTAWTRGQTGYPIVDAGMRQLGAQGYMHNRVRMIAASFLIKDLLVDWRRGMDWFRDTLLSIPTPPRMRPVGNGLPVAGRTLHPSFASSTPRFRARRTIPRVSV